MKELVEEEERILSYKGRMLPAELLRSAKLDGFSDRYLSQLLAIPEEEIRAGRESLGIVEAWVEFMSAPRRIPHTIFPAII